jgi:hypothetical protein
MQEAKIYVKDKYLGSIVYVENADRFFFKGNKQKMKLVFSVTKGIIDNRVYCKLLPDLLRNLKSIKVQLNFGKNLDNSPQAFVADVILPSRRYL